MTELTDPCAVVGLGLQLGQVRDLFEEVGLLHPRLGAPPLELRPRVRQDHLEIHRKTCHRDEEDEEGQGDTAEGHQTPS